MPNALGRGAPSFGQGVMGLADMLASALRGGVVGVTGLPGDLEEAIRAIRGSEGARFLPTSEEVSEYLPKTGADKGFQTFEKMGEFLPTSPAKAAPVLAKATAAGPAMAALHALPKARKDLALYHTTDLDKSGGLPKELTHPSLMITSREQGIKNEFGKNIFVPDPSKFEPKTSPSVIKATDFYSPRRKQAEFVPGDEGDYARVKDNQSDSWPRERLLRDAAYDRMKDKYSIIRSKGGVFAETESTDMLGPKAKSLWPKAVAAAPRFQSFKHFEDSPKGAARLTADALPRSYSQNFEDDVASTTRVGYRLADPANPGQFLLPTEYARRYGPGMLMNRNVWENGGRVYDSGNYELLSPNQLNNVLGMLRKSYKQNIHEAPSEYAEVKRYGHVPLAGENFPYAILEPKTFEKYSDALRKRGIKVLNEQELPVDYEPIYGSEYDLINDRWVDSVEGRTPDSQQVHELISEMQSRALRGR